MVFFMEALVLCLLFTAGVVASLLHNPLDWISSYPPAIKQRAKELGLVPMEEKRMSTPELVRKLVASLLMAAVSSVLLVYVNGAETFWQGFSISYGLCLVLSWYDALVLDCLWFCHSKRVIIPGTEDMQDSYHDYGFHLKMSVLGMVISLPIALLSGLGVLLLR